MKVSLKEYRLSDCALWKTSFSFSVRYSVSQMLTFVLSPNTYRKLSGIAHNAFQCVLPFELAVGEFCLAKYRSEKYSGFLMKSRVVQPANSVQENTYLDTPPLFISWPAQREAGRTSSPQNQNTNTQTSQAMDACSASSSATFKSISMKNKNLVERSLRTEVSTLLWTWKVHLQVCWTIKFEAWLKSLVVLLLSKHGARTLFNVSSADGFNRFG